MMDPCATDARKSGLVKPKARPRLWARPALHAQAKCPSLRLHAQAKYTHPHPAPCLDCAPGPSVMPIVTVDVKALLCTASAASSAV